MASQDERTQVLTAEYRALYRIFLQARSFLASRKRDAATKAQRRHLQTVLTETVAAYQDTYERPREAAWAAADAAAAAIADGKAVR